MEVTGLTPAETRALRDARLDDARWQALFKVTVAEAAGADSNVPPIAGRYTVDDGAVRFTPRFPFDPGRSYRAVFDPAALPRPRHADPTTAIVSLPALATTPTTVVTAVHPSANVVPENLLRMYIEFSAPMGNSGARDVVRLIDRTSGKDEVVEAPFLPVEADFWNPDHTRFTLFLDPGRVKQGILPNRQSGRPLRAGHRYVLDIDPAWEDANHLPLKTRHRHEFAVGPAVERAIALSEWTITPPSAGTRDALAVAFPRPLDHAVMVRALGIEGAGGRAVDGTIAVADHDTRWTFTPASPWTAGGYQLIALAFLEDPQGNQIDRAFEVRADEALSGKQAYRVAFFIR